MKKFLLCPNVSRDIGMKVTNKVAGMLAEMGAQYDICPVTEELKERLRDTEMVITFGGDGTILHAARSASVMNVPLLGVNLGHKGFISELEAADVQLIGKAVSGDYTIERRMMLDIELIRDSVCVYDNYALNDAVVGGMARTIEITAFGDGRRITSFSGDGIVAATPTGSTAYSLAAGGPVVEPVAENIIITPICPHVLLAKPYVLSAERVVTVELGELYDKVAYLSTDGGAPVPLLSGDLIRIKRSAMQTMLVRLTDSSFYEKVSKKLGE